MLIAGEKSNNCLEGCRLPATDSFINFQNINSYRLEGAEMEENNKCFKCGSNDRKLIVHHLSYHPEKTVLCCLSCHKNIHNRIRKENLCLLSVDEVDKLSSASSSKRCKEKKPEKYKKLKIRYYENNKKRIIKRATDYRLKNIYSFQFYTPLETAVSHIEEIAFNLKNGNVAVTNYFRAHHDNKLLYLTGDEMDV